MPLRAIADVLGPAEPGQAAVRLTVEADVRAFAFAEKGGTARDTLEFLLLVAREDTGEFTRFDQQFEMSLRPESRARYEREGFPITRDLALAPGTYQARIVVREGRFVEKATGRPFVPLGANYYRVGAVKSGKQGHSAFCPGSYDAAYIEAMMASLAASGMNTVRTFHSYLLGDDGILASPQARAIAPGYAANVVHFLQQARRHGLRVIFTWDIWSPGSDWWSSEPLPQEERYGLLSTTSLPPVEVHCRPPSRLQSTASAPGKRRVTCCRTSARHRPPASPS